VLKCQRGVIKTSTYEAIPGGGGGKVGGGVRGCCPGALERNIRRALQFTGEKAYGVSGRSRQSMLVGLRGSLTCCGGM
jgi:hypothetical protein